MTRATLPILVAGLVLGSAPALAQDTGEAAVLEEEVGEEQPKIQKSDVIFVTARKREESLQEVPVAVTVISAEILQDTAAGDIAEIQAQVPNLSIYPGRNQSTTLTAFMRGIGQADPLWGVDPGVGLYLDDVYIARPQGALLDVFDRVGLDWLPAEDVTVKLRYDRTEDDAEPKGYARLAPKFWCPVFGITCDPLPGLFDTEGGIDPANGTDSEGYSMVIEWNISDDWLFKSITAHRESDTRNNIDFDTTPAVIADTTTFYFDEQDSQEFQLIYSGGERFNGVLGFYYFDGFAGGLVPFVFIGGYITASRGFKSGGYNVRAQASFFPESALPFEDEELTVAEVGLKSLLADRWLVLNAAAFYGDYTDIQVSTFTSFDSDGDGVDDAFFGNVIVRPAADGDRDPRLQLLLIARGSPAGEEHPRWPANSSATAISRP